jgi:hypothetical protein
MTEATPGAIQDPYEMQKNLPTSPDQLLARLGELGISSHTVDHAPVFTVEESKELADVEAAGTEEGLVFMHEAGLADGGAGLENGGFRRAFAEAEDV